MRFSINAILLLIILVLIYTHKEKLMSHAYVKMPWLRQSCNNEKMTGNPSLPTGNPSLPTQQGPRNYWEEDGYDKHDGSIWGDRTSQRPGLTRRYRRSAHVTQPMQQQGLGSERPPSGTITIDTPTPLPIFDPIIPPEIPLPEPIPTPIINPVIPKPMPVPPPPGPGPKPKPIPKPIPHPFIKPPVPRPRPKPRPRPNPFINPVIPRPPIPRVGASTASKHRPRRKRAVGLTKTGMQESFSVANL